MSYMDTATSSATPEWPTPQWLVDQLAAEFGPFDTDPAATSENAKARPEVANGNAERVVTLPPARVDAPGGATRSP